MCPFIYEHIHSCFHPRAQKVEQETSFGIHIQFPKSRFDLKLLMRIFKQKYLLVIVFPPGSLLPFSIF